MMETFKKQRQPAVEGNHQKSRRFCPASEALISRVSSCWCWVLEVWHEGIQKHRRWAVWPRCPADDGGKLRSLWELDQLSRWRCLLGIFLPSNWWVLTTAGITFSLVFVSRCLWQATFFPGPMVGWWKMVAMAGWNLRKIPGSPCNHQNQSGYLNHPSGWLWLKTDSDRPHAFWRWYINIYIYIYTHTYRVLSPESSYVLTPLIACPMKPIMQVFQV